MHKVSLLPLLLTCLLPAAIATANAAERPDCSRPLTLALHEHGLLYNASNGTGIDRDFADELIRRSGCTVTVALMPRSRIWKLIEAGALDFSLSGINNPERDKFASFAWYFADKYSLLVRRDAQVKQPEDFEATPELKLGAIRSFRYSDIANRLVDKLDQAERVVYASNYETLYKNLALGRIHGIIIEPFDDPSLDQYHVRDLVEIIDIRDIAIPHGLIMSKKTITPAEEAKWRALVDGMRADGSVQRIFEKYFKRELARSMTNF